MALFSTIINKVSCGLAELLGTGLKFCKFDFRTPSVIALVQKGLKILPGDDFNLAYVQALQQQGKATILKGVVDFADNTPDNDRGTRAATGKMFTTLKHPYMWTFTFDNGLNFYKAITKLDSNEQYDIILFDTKGDVLMSMDAQGNGRGLDLGLLDTGKYVIGNENSQTITVQVDRQNFDNTVSWITNENLDFNAGQDLDGYNDVELAMVAPANLATTVVFTVSAKSNNKLVPLEGLVVADLLYQVDGVTVVPSLLTASATIPGQYTLTVAALATGDVLTLKLYDAVISPPANIINMDGVMFKSNLATTTVL
jgi:hypothetical protein